MSTIRLKPIYLDYAATTPLLPSARRAMEPFLKTEFGNAGSLHLFGQKAVTALDDARETIARAIGAELGTIVFTGSATEANNLFLRGAVKKWRAEKTGVPKILISAVEHDSILETARDLERDGVQVAVIPVNSHGIVDLKKLEQELTSDVAAISVLYVSNEIGTVQPITEISRIIFQRKERGFLSKKSVSEAERARFTAKREERGREASGRASGWVSKTPSFRERNTSDSFPLFHTDAAQALRYLDCDVEKLGVDAMTLSAHKIGGPKGVGALFTRVKLPPFITGGGQESGLRAGTENIAGISGFAAAVRETEKKRKSNAKKVYLLRALFASGLRNIVPDVQWNGPDWDSTDAGLFAPHILNAFFPAHLAEELLVRFDRAGVAVSSGSACSARASKLSHVLAAIGCATDRIQCSLRFSFGPELTPGDIKEALGRINSLL